MKASFVLLANQEVHNRIRKISWEFHQKYRTGTRHASLPPHISIKQPFTVSDLPALEEYMDELAISIQPFDVSLGELEIVPIPFDKYTEYGILWANVLETEILRGLHNRINEELNLRFGNSAGIFDGASFHFHMTIMMGGQLLSVYRRFQNELPASRIDMCYTVRELALFVYDEPMGPQSDYLCYKIVPIGNK